MKNKRASSKKNNRGIPKYALQNQPSKNAKLIIQASPQTNKKLVECMRSPVKKLIAQTTSNLSFFVSPNTGKSRCVDTDENATETYRHIISADFHEKKINIFMTETPEINKESAVPKSISIDPHNLESLMEFCDDYPEIMHKPSQFSFEITRDALVKNKRKYTQKNITHYTAKEFLEIFAKKLPPDKQYHLAHRRGHHLGGSGTADNLDAGTAGSNYTTLCYIEATVHNLLTNGDAEIITVTGDVTYDSKIICVVRHIDYCVYADGVKLFTKRIEHLEHRKPRLEEHLLALGLAEFMINNAIIEQKEISEEWSTTEKSSSETSESSEEYEYNISSLKTFIYS